MSVHHVNFIVNSEKNIYSGTNPIKLPLNNVGNDCRVVRIVVKSATIPNVFYNIRNNVNNKVYVDTGSNLYLFTIPEGQYTLSQLLTFLNNSTAFTSSGTTLTFDPSVNKIITNVTGAYFQYIPEAPTLLPSNTPIFGFYKLLGLVPGTTYNFTTGANMHPNINDLSGVKNIYVNCSFTKLNAFDSRGYKDLGAIIPMDVPFGSVKFYVNQEQTLDSINRDPTYSQNLTDPEITLTDVDGNVLNTNGIQWEMCFKVYHAVSED